MDWFTVWSKRKILPLKEWEVLLQNDGFDCGSSRITPDDMDSFYGHLKNTCNILKDDTIYEVGCGSGGFLYPFIRDGHYVGGCDFSGKQISAIQRIFPGYFNQAEAVNMPAGRFDVVCSFSVFQYFDNYDYAEEVFRKMLKKARKRVLVLDVPDRVTKHKAEALRAAEIPGYKERYKELSHLYYDIDFFHHITRHYPNASFRVFYYVMEGYPNSRYRFNVEVVYDD